MEKFIDHIKQSKSAIEPINEASFLSKGFALTQLSKFRSVRSKLKSGLSKLKSSLSKVKQEDDTNKKLNELAEAMEEFSSLLQLQADLAASIMNTIVADNLLSANITKALKTKNTRRR